MNDTCAAISSFINSSAVGRIARMCCSEMTDCSSTGHSTTHMDMHVSFRILGVPRHLSCPLVAHLLLSLVVPTRQYVWHLVATLYNRYAALRSHRDDVPLAADTRNANTHHVRRWTTWHTAQRAGGSCSDRASFNSPPTDRAHHTISCNHLPPSI